MNDVQEFIEVRATRDDPGHVNWCHEEDAHQFSVYQGHPGAMLWVADFAKKGDALDFAHYRALAKSPKRLTVYDRINQV